jgi:hypothetical protein
VSEADFLAEISENTFGSETEVELGLDALVMRLAGAIAYRRWLDRWRWGVGRSIDPLVDLADRAAIDAEFFGDSSLRPTAFEKTSMEWMDAMLR